MKASALTIVIALILVGCLGEDEPRDMLTESGNISGESGNPATPGTSPSPDGTAQPVALGRLFQLDGCTWFQAPFDYPLGTNPTPVPAGWDSVDPKPLSTNVLRIYDCASVALDELDRPARLLIETSNAGGSPEACRDPERNVSFLVNLFTDDEAIAQALRDRYHAPARLASISTISDETGTTWTWSEGGHTSTMFYPLSNIDEREVSFTDGRIIWLTPNGTNTLETRYTAIGPNGGQAAQGNLAPGHYLGANGAFIGLAGVGPEQTVAANIRARGPLCEPLES